MEVVAQRDRKDHVVHEVPSDLQDRQGQRERPVCRASVVRLARPEHLAREDKLVNKDLQDLRCALLP